MGRKVKPGGRDPGGARELNLDEFAKLMKGLTAPIRPVATCASMASANGR